MRKSTMRIAVALIVGLVSSNISAQSILGFPSLSQLDSTTYQLTFSTVSAAIISVHAAEDTTYRSAFIFLGRTVGDSNLATIKLDRLRNNASYYYRIFIGTQLSLFSGTFNTGTEPVKSNAVLKHVPRVEK